jgi:hypothetical protein
LAAYGGNVATEADVHLTAKEEPPSATNASGRIPGPLCQDE